ncbi:hypothetical protein HPB48_025974 [Haemaphysalis longicornis]|uniref:MADF domain-containing protein n=1 Tax=Haemaphysalis longicornis TaxID=44386 RepID=A0A9J6HB52_HAELO|nr:hypothetical protein HPB48_025974 [Haemaphysalis longicornis]
MTPPVGPAARAVGARGQICLVVCATFLHRGLRRTLVAASMNIVQVTERFVEAVRQFPFLFNKMHPEFKDKHAKRNRWDIIGTEFGLTGEQAAVKFKNLRDRWLKIVSAHDAKQKSGAPGKAGKVETKWALFDVLDSVLRDAPIYAKRRTDTPPSSAYLAREPGALAYERASWRPSTARTRSKRETGPHKRNRTVSKTGLPGAKFAHEPASIVQGLCKHGGPAIEPHVFKNIQGQLLHSETFTLGKEIVKEQGLPGKTVSLEHIQAVLEFDTDDDLKVANKLSDIYTSSGHFTKTKVNVAVQMFREAPPAIRYLIKIGEFEPEAEGAAWFLELVIVSKWYTLMSSRHPVVALSYFDRLKHEDAVKILELACTTFCRMNMGETAHWKPSQAGLLISTTVVLRLSEELLNKRGYRYLLRGRLIRIAENIFSIIRLRKAHPEQYDVKVLEVNCVSHSCNTAPSSYNL